MAVAQRLQDLEFSCGSSTEKGHLRKLGERPAMRLVGHGGNGTIPSIVVCVEGGDVLSLICGGRLSYSQ